MPRTAGEPDTFTKAMKESVEKEITEGRLYGSEILGDGDVEFLRDFRKNHPAFETLPSTYEPKQFNRAVRSTFNQWKKKQIDASLVLKAEKRPEEVDDEEDVSAFVDARPETPAEAYLASQGKCESSKAEVEELEEEYREEKELNAKFLGKLEKNHSLQVRHQDHREKTIALGQQMGTVVDKLSESLNTEADFLSTQEQRFVHW